MSKFYLMLAEIRLNIHEASNNFIGSTDQEQTFKDNASKNKIALCCTGHKPEKFPTLIINCRCGIKIFVRQRLLIN